jgi:hypothetical protein
VCMIHNFRTNSEWEQARKPTSSGQEEKEDRPSMRRDAARYRLRTFIGGMRASVELGVPIAS